MPTIFRIEGFVFSFFSADGSEPIHVHVRKAGGSAKIWIEPVSLGRSENMHWRDLKRAVEIAEEHQELIVEKWNEYFKEQ